MENDYFICKYNSNCQHSGDKDCSFGIPMPRIVLNKVCGGCFNPQFTIFCEHPAVRAGVLLIKAKSNNIEGNYHNIWIH